MHLKHLLLITFLLPLHAAASAPLSIDVTDENIYGFRFEGVRSNPESAAFSFEGAGSDITLQVDGFDIDTRREVEIFINGQSLGNLEKTGNLTTGPSEAIIPANVQVGGANVLEFRQQNPGWTWGVTNLVLKSAQDDDNSLPASKLVTNELESGRFGFSFEGISTNRDAKSFSFDNIGSDLTLTVDGYDIDNSTEVSVWLNGQFIDYLDRTGNNSLGTTNLRLPSSEQLPGTNQLEFRQRTSGWRWGVTNLLLQPATTSSNNSVLTIGVIETQTYGHRFNGSENSREIAAFSFESSGSDLTLQVTGYDIDSRTEVSVFVNDTDIGNLAVTDNNSLADSSFSIPMSSQVQGSNTLEFRQRRPGWIWGVTDILLTDNGPTDNEPTDDVPPESTNGVPDIGDYTLVFSDEFNASPGSTLNPSKWDTALLWGPYFPINNEEQMYVDTLGMHAEFSHTPFEFTGSTLKITATPTSPTLQPPPRPPEGSPDWQPRSYSEYRYNGPSDEGPGYQASDVNYLSGMITTYDSLKMTHGYVEMRAKLPAGRGLWPAFWMLTTHYVEDVPEIDVMEFLGQDTDRLYHTYHYFDIEDNWRKISTPSFTTLATDWTQGFHTFGMAWSPTEIIWYVNGAETRRVTRSEYTIPNQAMYILANLAVGGNWPGAPDGDTVFPATFEIDYIRAYKRKLAPALNLSKDYQLMFSDDFNGSSLDPAKWNTHFLWGPYFPINNEEQYYVDALGSDAPNTTAANSPFVVSNGVLSIVAKEANDPDSFQIPNSLPAINDPIWTDYPEFQRNTSYTPANYTSGIITSYDAFKFAHGYAEIRAKVPSGDGLWPAFWLLNGYYVNIQPEIDIMEMRGEFPNEVVHSYHRLVDGVMTPESATTSTPSIDYSQDFHTYGVRWQPDRIDWYIDGNIVHTFASDDIGYQVMYVLANLAVGGDFSNGTPVDVSRFNAAEPVSLDIDYIKVYQEKHKEN